MKVKSKAFTLLECLVALLVISGSVLVIEGLSKLLRGEIIYLQNPSEKDWQSFCNQIRSELQTSEFVKVENNFLYVRKDGDLRFGQSLGTDDFRKTSSKGQGYQPMLYHVKTCQISEENKVIKIQIQFDKGEEKIFYYKF